MHTRFLNLTATHRSTLLQLQDADVAISAVKQFLTDGTITSPRGKSPITSHQVPATTIRKMAEKSCISDGFLVSKSFPHRFRMNNGDANHDGTPLIYLPHKLQNEALWAFHDSPVTGNHRDGTALCLRIEAAGYTFHHIRQLADQWVSRCITCTANKNGAWRQQPEAISINTLPQLHPMRKVFVDCVGPFKHPAPDGSTHALVMIDAYTHFCQAVPIKGPSAEAVARGIFDHWICVFNVIPTILASDNGPEFANSLLAEFTKMLGTTHQFSMQYHPETQGLVERCNHSLISWVKTQVSDDHRSWFMHIRCGAHVINVSNSSSLGCSPHAALFGTTSTGALHSADLLPTANAKTLGRDYLDQLREILVLLRHKILLTKAGKEGARALARNITVRKTGIQPGNIVRLRENLHRHDLSGKLLPRYTGFWEVTEVNSYGTQASLRQLHGEGTTTVSCRRLKKVTDPFADLITATDTDFNRDPTAQTLHQHSPADIHDQQLTRLPLDPVNLDDLPAEYSVSQHIPSMAVINLKSKLIAFKWDAPAKWAIGRITDFTAASQKKHTSTASIPVATVLYNDNSSWTHNLHISKYCFSDTNDAAPSGAWCILRHTPTPTSLNPATDDVGNPIDALTGHKLVKAHNGNSVLHFQLRHPGNRQVSKRPYLPASRLRGCTPMINDYLTRCAPTFLRTVKTQKPTPPALGTVSFTSSRTAVDIFSHSNK